VIGEARDTRGDRPRGCAGRGGARACRVRAITGGASRGSTSSGARSRASSCSDAGAEMLRRTGCSSCRASPGDRWRCLGCSTGCSSTDRTAFPAPRRRYLAFPGRLGPLSEGLSGDTGDARIIGA